MSEKGGDSSRLKWVGIGLVLGFAWGTVMWGITGAAGNWTVWLYLSLTMAMIGGGIAAIFGAMNARKRGERVSPRIATPDAAAAKAVAKAEKAADKAAAKQAYDEQKRSH